MKRTPLARFCALAWVVVSAHLAQPVCFAEAAQRIVLVNADQELARAAHSALAAWRLELIAVDDGALSGMRFGDAGLSARLRSTASEYDASAVVWRTREANGDAISVYERATDRILGTRPIPSPPFDAATAAAVVLTVKTLLRHSAAAPEPRDVSRAVSPAASEPVAVLEQEGPASAPEPAAQPTATPSPAPTGRGLPAESAAQSVKDPPAPSHIHKSTDDGEPAGPEWELAAAGGIRSALVAAEPEARFAASAALWPDAGLFGVVLTVSAGSGFRVRDASLDARLLEPALALALLVRARVSENWRASASLGPALHLSLLRGELTAGSDRSLDVMRATAHAHLALHLDVLALPLLRVGVWAQTELALWNQRYWVGDQRVLESRRFAFSACLAASIPIRL